ncbi:response regulator [Pseudoroseomonas ludipueritiae]|uniref:histidine kinase n=1 Tax=Pseudoroseomonas ludipueritiae TaxID=198093 RepID=A0ABR7R7P3_9PROT|nr:response regulator [Pseudoroseomonas ludipueritiae]MBC9177791.1 response regulator [Pseudoroseomonas ludipueritiae]
MQLHIPTLLVVSTLLAITLGVMWLFLAWGGSRVGGLRHMGAANLLFAAGTVLSVLRGTAPAFLSIDIANGLILLACGLCWATARRFDDRPAPWSVVLAGALAWLLACRFPGITGTVEARVLILNLMCGGYILAASWQFSRRWQDMRLFRSIVSISFGLHGVLILLRPLPSLLQDRWHVTEAMPSSMLFGAALVEAMVHLVGVSFAMLAMIREREQHRAVAEIAISRDAADRANNAKSRFLARMSHELRTPLNGVLGLAQVLAANRSLPAEARSHGTMIERAGRHLLALVNDVLDLSQVEAGRVSFDQQPVPLGRLIDSAAVLVRPAAAGKQIELKVSMAPDCPQVVLGDELRLRQVLLNLLGNGVKFTPEQGEVWLEILPMPGEGIRIEVTDTGPGIPPEQRGLLFRDFSQVPGHQPPREGNGLGLAISAGLVEAMGGCIGMAPGPNGFGSRFWVELPLPSAIGSIPAAPAIVPGQPGRILVVDDVALNRLVVQALLESADYEVIMAASGREAIAALSESRFDLVLMDVQMPEMDGLEATRYIRASEAARPNVPRTPIVALTGEEMKDEVQACFDAGMDGHLSKPADRAALISMVRRITSVSGKGNRPPLSGAA